MSRNGLKSLAALAALGAVAGPTVASIPVPVRLVVVSDDLHGQALNRAYAEYLSETRNFLIADGAVGGPNIYSDRLGACVKAEETGLCARAEIPPHDIHKQYPPVALLAARVSESEYRWRCVGAGNADYWPERQTLTIDLSEAMFGSSQKRAQWRDKALDCIFAAGTEAGGRIKISRD